MPQSCVSIGNALTHYPKHSFLAFGLALDPRQQKLFGMFAGPIAVGCTVGLISFASGTYFQSFF